MRYIKYLLFLLISLMPVSVLAYGVQLSCPKEIKPNDTFKCTIYSPSFCSEITMELVLPNGFTLKSESAGRNFKSSSTGNNLSYAAIGEIDRVLSTITIEAPSESNTNNTIELRNLKYKYTNEDSEYTITTNITENFTFTQNTTTTQNNINNHVLTLDPNNDSDEIQTLSCTPANGKCDISLENANVPSKEGFIFKGWGKEKNCLTGELNRYTLSEDTLLYACYVSNMVGHLKSLTIDGYELLFNPNQYNYELNVKEEESKLSIKAEGYNQNAKIDIDNPELTENDTIIINVTEDDITSTYYIKVTKGNQNNQLIKNISIANYDLNFDSSVYEYNLTISDNVDKLNIIVEPNDNAEINIVGNENLKDGSIITVNGKNDNSDVTYTINVLFDNNLNILYYFIAGFIVFMFIVYFIVRHYKIKNGEIPSKTKKANKPKKEKVKEKKPKKEKKKKNSKGETTVQKEEIETLDL